MAKRLVIDEAREGWERLKVEGSPTFVLPSGKQVGGLGLPKVELDESRHHRAVAVTPADCQGDGCLDAIRRMLAEAQA